MQTSIVSSSVWLSPGVFEVPAGSADAPSPQDTFLPSGSDAQVRLLKMPECRFC